MKAESRAILEELSFPALVPNWLPDGLGEPSLRCDSDSYLLSWSGPGLAVKVQGTCGGVGDFPPGERRFTFSSALFGEAVLEIDDNEITTQWLSEVEGEFPAYNVSAIGLSPDQVISVVNSLAALG
ncbi:MAG: hypothetical protein AB7S38_16300 [Vulcanimicrobiota bacterium]